MKQLLFYDQPVALHKERHRDWKIEQKGDHFSFAKWTNSVIVTGMEFAHLAKEYPIVFAKMGEKVIPLALLGLRTDENLFVNPVGQWNARYIPAFVRRYPFVLADAGGGNWTVYIDEGFGGFNTATGMPLFDEKGEQTPLLEKAVLFLKEFQGQNQRTVLFVNRLLEMDLLSELTAQVEVTGGVKISMGGLMAIDEKKLLALDQARSLSLFRAGELGWIYAHLFSLANLGLLSEMVGKTAAENKTERKTKQLVKPSGVDTPKKGLASKRVRKKR